MLLFFITLALPSNLKHPITLIFRSIIIFSFFSLFLFSLHFKSGRIFKFENNVEKYVRMPINKELLGRDKPLPRKQFWPTVVSNRIVGWSPRLTQFSCSNVHLSEQGIETRTRRSELREGKWEERTNDDFNDERNEERDSIYKKWAPTSIQKRRWTDGRARNSWRPTNVQATYTLKTFEQPAHIEIKCWTQVDWTRIRWRYLLGIKIIFKKIIKQVIKIITQAQLPEPACPTGQTMVVVCVWW